MPYTSLPAKTAPAYLNLTDYDAIKGNFEASAPDLYTAKGDLAPATGADAAARLAVGADDSELTPDASQTTGLAWQIRPTARAYNNASLGPYSAGGWNSVTLNSEDFDTDGVHSTSSNTSRMTIPANGAGLYEIGACIQNAVGGGGNTVWYVRLLKNGTTELARQQMTGSGYLTLSTLAALAVGDYVEVQVYGVTDTVTVTYAAAFTPSLWISWQRRQ